MIETSITEFLRTADEYQAANPDSEYVWRVCTGTRRGSKQVVPPGSAPFPEEAGALFDILVEKLEGLVAEPERHAWVELLKRTKSRVLFYVHVDIAGGDDEDLEIVSTEASGIIAAQLIKSNDQLIGLLTVKERMVAHLSQKMFDTGLTLRQIETERFMEERLSEDQSLARAIEALTPMLSIALAKWAATSQAKEEGKEKGSDEKADEPQETQEGRNGSFDVEDLMARIEYAVENHPELLTQERINRVFGAFSAAHT